MSKTGMEVLIELYEQIKTLNKKVDLIDQNLKVLINQQKAKNTLLSIKQPSVQSLDPSQIKAVPDKKTQPGVMVSGKISIKQDDGKEIMVSDASIKVFNDKDVLVKETKTNRGGVWMCLLQPGGYVAEINGKFKGQELVTQNKTFVIPSGIKEFEVQ